MFTDKYIYIFCRYVERIVILLLQNVELRYRNKMTRINIGTFFGQVFFISYEEYLYTIILSSSVYFVFSKYFLRDIKF